MVTSFTPRTLDDALRLRSAPGLVPYTGGTDLMVRPNLSASYLFLNKIPEMRKITQDDDYIRFGAACTFAEVASHPLTPAILREACLSVAAPAIRNVGSVGGNIANGSAKADSALVFMATDSLLRLASAQGERILPLKDFYLGRKKTALADDELLVEILMPRRDYDNYSYTKVGARGALAISRVSFAGVLEIAEGKIAHCATAFGAVCDVILRPSEIDAMLIGNTVAGARGQKAAYLQAMGEAIVPIRGRVGIQYRKDVCMALLRDFLETNGL